MIRKSSAVSAVRAIKKFFRQFAKGVFSGVRMIYFSTVGAVNKFFFGTNPSLNPFSNNDIALSRVAVLGRGVSSKLFQEASSERNFPAVILCNFENRDFVSEDLRKLLSKIPYVVLLGNRDETAPSFQMAKRVGINCVIQVRNDGQRVSKRVVWRLNRLGQKVWPLPEKLSDPLFERAQGTGNYGVALASLLSNQVEIFGIEFYRTDYIAGPYEKIAKETGETLSLRAGSTTLQRSFERVARHQTETQFVLHCHAEHSITEKNVTLKHSPIKEQARV